jgi:acylphosphatase
MSYEQRDRRRRAHLSEAGQIIRHVLVHGRVQGVGFRAFVEHHALRRGLSGWVRNRRDGSVEAVFAGPEKSVIGMIEACRTGPLGARVYALDQREGTADELKLSRPGELFSALPTA